MAIICLKTHIVSNCRLQRLKNLAVSGPCGVEISQLTAGRTIAICAKPTIREIALFVRFGSILPVHRWSDEWPLFAQSGRGGR
jgi:hypothetical protein